MLNKYLLFISPHLDDIIFSLEEYINEMISCNYKIIIATVFTKSNLKVLKKLKGDYFLYGNYKTRILEDINAIKLIDENIIIEHLNFPEEIFRKSNNINNSIIKSIDKLVTKYNIEKIFFPLSIGNHVDHKIVYNLSFNFKNKLNVFYYFDYPYCTIHLNTKVYLSSLGYFESLKITDLYNFFCNPIYKSCPKIILLFKMFYNILLYFLNYVYFLFIKSYNFDINIINIDIKRKYNVMLKYKTQINPIFGSCKNLYNLLLNNPYEKILQFKD